MRPSTFHSLQAARLHASCPARERSAKRREPLSLELPAAGTHENQANSSKMKGNEATSSKINEK